MGNRVASNEPSVSSPVLKAGQIGIVTVTYNSASVLPDFFDSLAAQTCREYTLYVIDNASKDNTLELCRKRVDLPIVILANDANLGVAEGNNQGIRSALEDGCEFVLLLNNDTVFGGDLLDELRKGLIQEQCAMVTPKILYHDEPSRIWAAGGRFQPWCGYRTLHFGEGELDGGQFSSARVVTYSPTCCVLVRRDVFDRIGLMDPRYFVYSDDTDFMYRAMKAGIVMKYIPSSGLLHKVSSLTGGGSSTFALRYGTRNRIYFIRKNLPRFKAAFWAAAYRLYIGARRLTRRDSKATWALRRDAVAEGLKMEIPEATGNKPRSTGSGLSALRP